MKVVCENFIRFVMKPIPYVLQESAKHLTQLNAVEV